MILAASGSLKHTHFVRMRCISGHYFPKSPQKASLFPGEMDLESGARILHSPERPLRFKVSLDSAPSPFTTSAKLSRLACFPRHQPTCTSRLSSRRSTFETVRLLARRRTIPSGKHRCAHTNGDTLKSEKTGSAGCGETGPWAHRHGGRHIAQGPWLRRNRMGFAKQVRRDIPGP